MKTKLTIKYFFSLAIFILIFISACTDYDEPVLIDDPDINYSASPVVSGIEPAGVAIAGVREIVINGQNFATGGNDTNWVYFGAEPALIKSVTQDKIIVYRPPNSGESLTIKVTKIGKSDPGALSVAKVEDYDLELPIEEFGDYTRLNYDLMAVEIDLQENIYVATRRAVFTAPPDGIDIVQLADLGSSFATITDIKFGPGGYLYILTGQREIYRMDLSSPDNPEEYIRISERAARMDFDANGNIYTGRRDGIIIVDAAKNELPATGHYDGINIIEIRVFNNELYVATADRLYKNVILGDGTLGDDQTLVEIKNIPGFSSSNITSFNLANDGTVYLCLQGHSQYSLFVLENDGSVTPFYTDDILPQRVDQIIWGSSKYAYLNRGSLSRDSVRVYRMGMEKEGAQYLGRNQ